MWVFPEDQMKVVLNEGSTPSSSTIRLMTKEIKLTCSLCGCKFSKRTAEVTFQNKKWVDAGKQLPKPYFCSRKCGQHYSGVTYTANRDVKSVANALRTREASKYTALKDWLTAKGVRFKFEHAVGNFVFDLAIKHEGRKILVEFDSRYHDCAPQKAIDKKKSRIAENLGWEVHRVHQPSSKRVPTKYVKSLVL